MSSTNISSPSVWPGLRSAGLINSSSNKIDLLNASSVAPFCKDNYQLLFIVLYSVIGSVILIGNGFSAVVFLATENLRRQYMNIFLISLAISDILMAILVAPLYATHCSQSCGTLGGWTKYCWLMRTIKDIVLIENMFNLFAITYDRYVAVLYPLRYNRKITRKRVISILVAVWLVPEVLAGVRNVWQHTIISESQLHYANILYNSIIIIMVVIIPIFLMALVNVRIVKAIKMQSRRICAATCRRRDPGTLVETRTCQRTRNKGTMACVLVVFIFVICWLPRCVYNMYIFSGFEGGLDGPVFFKVSFTFLFLQSSLNPFIYSFYRSDFRRAALRCCPPTDYLPTTQKRFLFKPQV